MKNNKSKIGVLFICILLLLNDLCVPAAALETPPETVKIGYYYDSDYFYRDEHGNYCGYDAEYFYEISKYTNWEYQYIDFDSFEEAYAALEKGEIDILPSLFYTQERAEHLLLSAYDMGNIYVTIVVAPENTKIAYGDLSALEGKKVGILSDSVDGEQYRSWAKEHDLHTDIIPMASIESLLSALDHQELDAVAISYLGASSVYRIVDEFSPMKMYFGMPKDHTRLMKQLNEALGEITIQTPDFFNGLYSRYYLANQKQTPVFTIDEKRYIRSAGPLTVALDQNNPPFSYQEKDGSIHGAVVDYFEHIAKLSGLKFTFLGCTNNQKTVEAVKNGKAHIAGNIVYDAIEASTDHILLTNPYLQTAITQVARRGTKETGRAAIPSNLLEVYHSEDAAEQLTLKSFDNAREAMQALTKGNVNSAILNTYSANYYMNNNRADRYNVTTLNGMAYQAAAGISFSADRRLYSVLNRCIRYSNTTTLSELIIKHSQADTSSVQTTLNRIPQYWLVAFAALMLYFVVILVVFIAVLKRRQREKDAVAAQKLLISEKEMHLSAVEKAAEEKNSFFSNISHDMRTPLNAVLGFTRLAKAEGISERQRLEYLNKIQSSGEVLLDLINDTLTISKANSGKLELRREPISSEELIETISALIGTSAAEKEITVSLNKAHYHPRLIMADQLVLQKIFLNILNNAVKYTPQGGHIWVDINDVKQPRQGEAATEIVIRDNGIGMSPEYLPHLFEPFSQEKQQGYEAIGTGLGLSIVKQLIDLMGGSITVSSRLGQGTEFVLRLHFEDAELPPKAEAAPKPHGEDILKGKRVLLCEDNHLNREIASTLLSSQGMQVDAAENGKIGVEKFASSAVGSYDIILMDIQMPLMNGYQAAEAIRGLLRPDAEKVPIVALTANAFEDDIRKAMEAGMNAHLAKPIEPERLFLVIAKMLSAEQ